MALMRAKEWIAGEVLTAADLNAEFDNILTDDGSMLGWPATADKDMDGNALLLSGDQQTTLDATTDLARIRIDGINALTVDGTVTTPVNGISVVATATTVAPYITSIGESNIDLNLVPNGTGALLHDGVAMLSHSQSILANQTFGS